MPEPDVAAEVRRLIAADPAALPALVAAILAERAADAYFLHGVGSDAAPPVGVIYVAGLEPRPDEA